MEQDPFFYILIIIVIILAIFLILCLCGIELNSICTGILIFIGIFLLLMTIMIAYSIYTYIHS